MMTVIHSLIFADSQSPLQTEGVEAVIQDALMKMFFEDLSPNAKGTIQERSIQDAKTCDGLYGIRCQNNEVQQVFYTHIKGGIFNIRALPNSLQKLHISSCEQTFEISLRSLPRNLIELNLSLNSIVGRVDLTTFPTKLETAEFLFNCLQGPICLHKLPPRMRILNLRANKKIEQKTVYYDFPESMEAVYLMYEWESSRIGKIRPIHPEKSVKETNIFKDKKTRNVS